MVSQISRTYDFDRKFLEKRCGLSASLYGIYYFSNVKEKKDKGYFLTNFLCSRIELKERMWKPGVVEHPTQNDEVSCGVFVLKVCGVFFFFLGRGTWEKKRLFSIAFNHIIVSVDCGMHCH